MAKAVFMVVGNSVKKGDNQIERFLSQAKNLKIYDISRSGQALYGRCHYRQLKRLKELAENEGLEFSVLMQTYRPIKYFLITFILSGLLLGFFWSSRVWTFVYYGCDELTAVQIHEFLEENGLRPGSRLKNTTQLSLKLKKTFPEIIFFDLKKDGVRLNIEVSKRSKEPEKTAKKEIITSLGGIVRYVNVILGDSLVKPGDVVYKGQVVIKGNPYAEGQVIGESVVEIIKKVPFRTLASVETGNKKKQLILRIGTKQFNIGMVNEDTKSWSQEMYRFGWAGNRRQFVEVSLVMYHELKEVFWQISEQEALDRALKEAEDSFFEISQVSKVLDKKIESSFSNTEAIVRLRAKIETDLTKERSGEY